METAWTVLLYGFYAFCGVVVLCGVIGALKRFFGPSDWRDGEGADFEPLDFLWWDYRMWGYYLRFLWGLVTFWK